MSGSTRRKEHHWSTLSDSELLELRLCDLKLELESSPLHARVQRLLEELDERGFQFAPHFWLSTEWFAPEDTPGIALPFYLAHPRLMRLERRMFFGVEGGTERWCMQLLRHECGHAIDTAYALHRRRRYRELFGNPAVPYPTHYTPRPFSRSYVLHLDLWYAQAHPVEDFAETFAVWLGQATRWRSRYKGWRALRKLEYVDELMREIRAQPPKVNRRFTVDPLSKLRFKLRTHYERKCERYGLTDKAFYDHELRRLFTGRGKEGVAASSFLRKHRKVLRSTVAHWTGEFNYTVEQVLEQMIERSRELKLRAVGDEEKLLHHTLAMISVQITNSLLSGRRGIPI